MLGDLLLRWTVRLALLAYAVFLLITAAGRADRYGSLLRGLWLTAGVLFLLHTLCAFHFVHHWSHSHAVLHTAKRTEELLGWGFGGGVYFNYLFVALWLWEAARFWKTPVSYGVGFYLLHGYLLFIAINGAIIFETGPTRIAGMLTIAAVLLLWLSRLKHHV